MSGIMSAMSNLYTAEATATGGRTGAVKSSDGRLDLPLISPRELGGDGGPGTNPEQLFAAGYAACFQSALGVVARREKVELPVKLSHLYDFNDDDFNCAKSILYLMLN